MSTNMFVKTSKELGSIVKKVRVSQRLTQARLAAVSDTGIRFIVDLEQGKPTCALDKALHVATMLGIKLSAEIPE